MADSRFGEEFERSWDAVLRGGPPAGGLEPGLAETLRRIQALNRVPPPDPEFVTRVRGELLSAVAPPIRLAPPAPAASSSLSDDPPRRLWPGAPGRRTDPSGSALAQFATAALLLIVLAVSLILFGRARIDRHEIAEIRISAIVGTPLPTPATPAASPAASGAPSAATATAGQGKTLGVGRADALPDNPAWLMTFHATVSPGGRFGVEYSEGPDLAAVTAGTLTYHADQPLLVTRGGQGIASTQEVIPAGADAVLEAGDAVLIPMGTNVSRRNDGSDPAIEVMSMLEGSPDSNRGRAGSSGALDLPIVVFHISDAHALPPAPVEIALTQITLAPGASFAPPAAAWWMVGASEEAYAQLDRQPDGTARNTGSAPIDLYLTTVEPSSEGTPAP